MSISVTPFPSLPEWRDDESHNGFSLKITPDTKMHIVVRVTWHRMLNTEVMSSDFQAILYAV